MSLGVTLESSLTPTAGAAHAFSVILAIGVSLDRPTGQMSFGTSAPWGRVRFKCSFSSVA